MSATEWRAPSHEAGLEARGPGRLKLLQLVGTFNAINDLGNLWS